MARSGHQRRTTRSNWRAQSVSVLWRRPRSVVMPLRGRQRGQDRQRPGAGRPGDRHQQHQADPAQPAGLDEVAVAGAHRVAVDALGGDPLAATPFQRVVDAERGAVRSARRRRRAAPSSTRPTARAGPRGAAEHAVIAVKLAHSGEPGHAQRGGDGALRRGEDRSHQQHLGVAPDASGEQRREGNHDGYHRWRVGSASSLLLSEWRRAYPTPLPIG